MQRQPTSPRQTEALSSPPMFLRMQSVVRITGLARSTIYRLIAEEEFPAQVRIGVRAVGWRPADIDRWSAQRPCAR